MELRILESVPVCRCWCPSRSVRFLNVQQGVSVSRNIQHHGVSSRISDQQHRRGLVLRAMRDDGPGQQQEGPADSKETEKKQTNSDGRSRPRLNLDQERRVRVNLKRFFILERVIKTLTISPGLTGTLAILSGRLLNLDPFGSLRWERHDAYVGLLCILPLLLLDAALMLPDFQKFNADERKRAVAMKLLNSDAKNKKPVQEAERPASSPSSGEQADEAGFSGMDSAASALAAAMSLTDRAPLTPLMRLKGSVMYVQGLLLQRSSKSDVLPLPVELTLLVLSKLGVTMLQFGITLDGITKWEVDRLYESGMGETFHILGTSMSLQESGQWAALGFMTGALVAMASVAAAMQEEAMVRKGEVLRKQLNEKTRKAMEFNLFQKGLKESSTEDPSSISPVQVADQLQKSLAASKKLHSAMEALVEKRKQDRSAQDLWNAVFVTAREVLGLWGVGASYILTGNLLAPLAASVAAGALRSGYSRVQVPRMRRRRAALLSKLKESVVQSEKTIAAAEKDEITRKEDTDE
ncbi:hypothetical protein COCOBI_01-2750 [Coccomyxa sp. Obi]|nr:hypothetical protein COCOBI_01-2750 [Coccomyxa sp. Obi]